jgi:hypothetical protein
MMIEYPDNGDNKLLQNVSNQDYQSTLYYIPDDHLQSLHTSHYSLLSVIKKVTPIFNGMQISSSLSKFNVQLSACRKGEENH